MPGLDNYTTNRDALIVKIRDLKEAAKLVDPALESELDHILVNLIIPVTNLDNISDEATVHLDQLELLLDQMSIRIQRKQESATHSLRQTDGVVSVSPQKLMECLKQSGQVDAQELAYSFEELLLLLTELANDNFRGVNAERVRTYALDIRGELLGERNGESRSYWQVLRDYGAEKAIELIERDPKGSEFRNLIENGTIDLNEIVTTLQRMVKRAETNASKRFFADLERELNGGQLEYIIPRGKRDPGDPFIVRLSKYINPNAVLASRLVTHSERNMRDMSIDLLKHVLQAVDDIEALDTQIKAQIQDAKGWIERKMKQQDELMAHIFESTDSLNVSSYREEAETEAAYLSLLLLKYALLELKDRYALFHSKLLEDAPAKLMVAFLNRKLIQYAKEVVDWCTKPERLREVQKGLSELRAVLQLIGDKLSLGGVSVYTEQLQPDYGFLFPHDAEIDTKRAIEFGKPLKKYADKIKKLANKEKDLNKAWTKLQEQMEGLQQELHSS